MSANTVKKYLGITGLLLLGFSTAIAQNTNIRYSSDSTVRAKNMIPQKAPVKKVKPISDEFNASYRLYTTGWGASLYRGFNINQKKSSFVSIELGEIKHRKQVKLSTNLQSVGGEKSMPFVFGKRNNFYPLRINYGQKIQLGNKAAKAGVSIHWAYQGGLSLGFQKPYYLQVITNNGVEDITYNEANKSMFTDSAAIIGGSGFMKGLNETKVIPGLSANTSFIFDFSNTRKLNLALVIGAYGDAYIKKIPIMVNQKDQFAYFGLYAGLIVGAKW